MGASRRRITESNDFSRQVEALGRLRWDEVFAESLARLVADPKQFMQSGRRGVVGAPLGFFPAVQVHFAVEESGTIILLRLVGASAGG